MCIMKIKMRTIASSPYATFKAKEWNSIITAKNLASPLGKVIISKRHLGKSLRFESKECPLELDKPKLIQLAFA